MNKQEAIQLLEEIGEKEDKLCPKCNSILLWKAGYHINKYGVKRQYYRCAECDKHFIIKDAFYNSKKSQKIIKFVLKHEGFSYYKISKFVKEELKQHITKRGVELIIKRFSK